MKEDIDQYLVARHFDLHAHEYETYAEVQREMAERLMARLAHVEGPHRTSVRAVLDIGAGTGVLTRLLFERYPNAEITALDISETMLERAREQLGATQVHWIQADVETWKCPRRYEVIASNAAFQWLNRPSEVVRKLSGCLEDGGMMAVATFGPRTFWELFFAFRQAGDPAPRRGPTLPPMRFWSEAVHACGLQVEVLERVRMYRVYPSVRDFLKTVKKMGASHAPKSDRPLSRRVLTRMEAWYNETFAVPGGVQATFEVIVAVARKHP
ncbi:MAG: malonyl-ACP O-methyltransferase BioC [Candidatus Carbobacillus altaicus]|uniref:Malonyl-[acyl-carrier protein] O-methyltransferase n=1 Tax=Candidatus Carbonibacillus altaicus TaxID=2163959 RepID=A0A2R6XYA5_9BACL|nr:malonyl-ACP O-methyltransferase BioC [Candidatus Carbobacillus altaicus]PTQ55409.1 MAG: Biotin synthesis protein BioC [Candidatus Carbobacillus altaicus]